MPLQDSLRRLIDYLRERDLVLWLGLALILGSAWAFVELADEVLEGELRAIDEQVLMTFRTEDPSDPIGSLIVEEAMRDLTALGSTTVCGILLFTVIGLLAMSGRWRQALFTLLAIGGGVALVFLLKTGFDRPRPDLVAHGTRVATASFPSGHATMAAVVYLTLAALLARTFDHRRLKVFIVTVATIVAIAVGVSRVYLGVHWPSDVVAGWFLGGGWAIATWLAERSLQHRGLLEPQRHGRIEPLPFHSAPRPV